ncbi:MULTISPECIES: hypothetical protein [Elizabethkingia]|uniref:Uncharacterized protein n=1 Tax=Elizabethkingia anophelis TaxID=1117645 RepID=A0A494GEY3_9FLAO|nr:MULTISPECIES: hypothetical protein [Elizabethkingia]AQX50616.1 hypothetical protein AYC66_07985 [Elizabethkingia anophelis]MCT4011411.1 hypothetical protein [Elizabethkingia anophelis]MDE5525267.1 hypothetical protein [Elizabethkingia meningoseptica]MDV3645048.1 hypothetical protein [Elizabethkingia anophelis]MDV3684769.1 hypothetical protein [Elizabethkingia anophelis]
MDEKAIDIEKLAPDLLLKRGVPVPVTAPLFLRIFKKKTIKLVLFHPTGRTLLKIASKYLSMGVINDEDLSLPDAIKAYADHGKKVHEIVALGFLNSPYLNWFHKPLAWWLRRKLTEQHFLFLFNLLMTHGGVEDFIATIRLIKTMRITKPMTNLSPTEKAS